jgi:hypothetical protein
MIFKPSRPSVGSARKEEGQNPSAVNQVGTRPPGRWGNARRSTAPAPQSKTSNPRLSPRGAGRAIAGNRAWAENPGRRASSRSTVLPSRAFVCADLKSLLGLVRGRGHRLTRRQRPGPSPTEPARRGIIERDHDPRRPQIENRDIRALAIEPHHPACRAPPTRSEQSPSAPQPRGATRASSPRARLAARRPPVRSRSPTTAAARPVAGTTSTLTMAFAPTSRPEGAAPPFAGSSTSSRGRSRGSHWPVA